MEAEASVATNALPKPQVIRVGVLFSKDSDLRNPALRYLILKLNSLQSVFEYEVLPCSLEHTPLAELDAKDCITPRGEIRDINAPKFLHDYVADLFQKIATYELQESVPHNYILITTTRFTDRYYSTRPELESTNHIDYPSSRWAIGNDIWLLPR